MLYRTGGRKYVVQGRTYVVQNPQGLFVERVESVHRKPVCAVIRYRSFWAKNPIPFVLGFPPRPRPPLRRSFGLLRTEGDRIPARNADVAKFGKVDRASGVPLLYGKKVLRVVVGPVLQRRAELLRPEQMASKRLAFEPPQIAALGREGTLLVKNGQSFV